jgi:hypothetical protein
MATIGTIMNLIERRTWNIGGYLLARVLDIAFSLVGFLALPILVAKNKSPQAAFRESAILLRKTWGTQLVGSMALGGMFGILAMLAIVPGVVGIVFMTQERADLPLFLGGIIVTSASGILLLVLMSASGAVNAVFRTALYLYASDGVVVGGFTDDLLKHSLGSGPNSAH